LAKGKVRVRRVMDTLNDETAALESGISLVRRQPESECARKPIETDDRREIFEKSRSTRRSGKQSSGQTEAKTWKPIK